MWYKNADRTTKKLTNELVLISAKSEKPAIGTGRFSGKKYQELSNSKVDGGKFSTIMNLS